nr:DUF4349 domain-containing protein [Patulibacter sp. SYSU D01012]
MRRDPVLSPEARADLEALDAALAGAPDADAELTALVADVAAARPAPGDDARVRLQARADAASAAAAGTDAARAPRRPRRVPVRPRRSRRLLGALAATCVVAGVAVAVSEQARDGAGTGELLSMQQELAPPAGRAASGGADAPSAADDRAAPERTAPGAGPGASGPASADRRVRRAVDQTVRVADDGVAAAAGRAEQVVTAAGGHVARSAVRERGSDPGAELELVVPTARLDATVAALGRLGRPVALDRQADDVTDAAVALEDHLRDARAERAATRLALARATGDERRAARRRELRILSSRVARLEGQVRAMRRSTDEATIALRLVTADAAVAAPVDDGAWGPGDAWRDASGVLRVAAGVALLLAVVLLPAMLLAGGGWALLRSGRRARAARLIDGA